MRPKKELLFSKLNRSLGVILSVTWAKIKEKKPRSRKGRIGKNEIAQITPELLFWKPNRSLGVILSVTLSAGQI